MAVLTTRGLSGQIGKQLVFKARGRKTIVSAYAEQVKKKGSELQNIFRNCFKRAQKRAGMDSRKAEIKTFCAPYLKEGQSVYHFLMGLYHREEIRMMKKGEKEYVEIEVLLSEEPRQRQAVVKPRTNEVVNNLTNSDFKPIQKTMTALSYPIRKHVAVKANYSLTIPGMINSSFYGGWVSTVTIV